jgi:hypothetical protein
MQVPRFVAHRFAGLMRASAVLPGGCCLCLECARATANRWFDALIKKGVSMAGRGPQTFKKRQKEQQRKEKQQEKIARRLQRKHEKTEGSGEPDSDSDEMLLAPEGEGQNGDEPRAPQPELQN